MKKLTCASFFAGVGGIDLGFEQAGFKTVYANEFDEYPAQIYEANSKLKVDVRDIREVKASEIPDFDIMLAGFPCQAFSLAGYRQGFDDSKGRGTLFFELVRLIKEKRDVGKQPSIVFFENVKNLVGHDNGNTFRVICDELDKLGYHITYQVLNAAQFGNIPHGRERIYIVGFLNKEYHKNFETLKPIKLTKKLTDVIDFYTPQDEKYYYDEGKYKGDIYELLLEAMKDEDIKNPNIYQWRRHYVRQNKSGVVPTLTANQGEGGHNVCLIKTADGRIRKMTPKECFNTQGFPKKFKIPKGMSDTRAYKAAGNSVVVPVINRIALSIIDAIKEE